MARKHKVDTDRETAGPRYRCTGNHHWTGPRSACIAKVMGTDMHYFCPECYHPCRVVSIFHSWPNDKLSRKPRPQRTPEQHEAWLNQPRTCTRCPFSGCNRDFPLVMGRGVLTARSTCKACSNAYRAARAKTVRQAKKERQCGIAS